MPPDQLGLSHASYHSNTPWSLFLELSQCVSLRHSMTHRLVASSLSRFLQEDAQVEHWENKRKIAKIMTIIKDLWKLLGLKGLSKRSCFSLFQNDAVNCGAPCWLSVIVLRMKPHCLQHLLRWDPLGSIGNKQVKRQLPKSRTPGCAASNAKCSIKAGKLYKSS